MGHYGKTIALISVFALTIISNASDGFLTDPYTILNRSFDEAGGLIRLRAERTSYSEGSFSVGGMSGTVKIWTQKPGMGRTEVNLGPLNMIQGDNGVYAWVLDQNGKVQAVKNPDDAVAKRRQLRKLIDEYGYAERNSSVFKVSLQGIELVEAESCYAVRVTNSINVDSYTYYINIHTFILKKARMIEDTESRDIIYADYRNVEGLLTPFNIKEIPHQTGQTQEISITRYDSNPKTDPSFFEPPSEITKDYKFASGDRAENIPFKYIGGHVYITVNTEGKERLWIIDTGAGVNVLNKAFADELGLTVEGDIKGNDASGNTISAGFTTLPPFSVGNIDFQKQTVAVIDMSELFRQLGPDIAGILGFDFLSRFVTKIDYANELISFYDTETFQYTGDGHEVEMHLRSNLFAVEAMLDGKHKGNWLFDVGAGTTSLDGRLALREGYTRKKGLLREGHGAGHAYQARNVRGDSIQFAGFTVYKPDISFHYGGTDTIFTADIMGTLGNSLFRHFVLYCDYSHERLIVEKGKEFNKIRTEDHSGLQLGWNLDHEIEVIYTSPDTPAEKAGFKKGDVLRSINGIQVNLFDGVVAVRQLLKETPGTTFNVVVSRAGKDKNLKLKLTELY